MFSLRALILCSLILLLVFTTRIAAEDTVSQNVEVEIASGHAQVHYLAKNLPVDFVVSCDGCDAMVTSEVDNVVTSAPFNFDRQLSSLSISGVFRRNNVHSSVDRVLVMRNPSPNSMKIAYTITERPAQEKEVDTRVYVVGTVVGVGLVVLAAIVIFLFTANQRRARVSTSTASILPQTIHITRPQVNYGTNQHVSTAPQQAQLTPVLPPVYFVYPVPPAYHSSNQHVALNVVAAGESPSSSAEDTTTTTTSVATTQSHPALYPTLVVAGGRKATQI